MVWTIQFVRKNIPPSINQHYALNEAQERAKAIELEAKSRALAVGKEAKKSADKVYDESKQKAEALIEEAFERIKTSLALESNNLLQTLGSSREDAGEPGSSAEANHEGAKTRIRKAKMPLRERHLG